MMRRVERSRRARLEKFYCCSSIPLVVFVRIFFPRSEDIVMCAVINKGKGKSATPGKRVRSLVIMVIALCGSAIAAAQDAASTPEAAAAASGVNTEAQDMLYYVCGQPGLEKTVTAPDPKHPFNLGITFVAQQNGAPLSQVAVRLRRHGRVLMDFVADGPRCLFSVPSASYRIEGTYQGEMKFEIVETETFDTQIKW
jgi:hypothetical protein